MHLNHIRNGASHIKQALAEEILTLLQISNLAGVLHLTGGHKILIDSSYAVVVSKTCAVICIFRRFTRKAS